MSLSKLPQPTLEECQHSLQLLTQIIQEINLTGPITFARFMELALYAPHLGYYRSGLQKFGKTGDFITAPELSPFFSKCVAKQCQQILTHFSSPGDILEFGPGSGIMAKEIITELAKLHTLPRHYYLLELSAELKHRQQLYLQQQLPEFFHLFTWLEQLPQKPINGIILANEVVDAMPVHKFCWQQDQLYEYCVAVNSNQYHSVAPMQTPQFMQSTPLCWQINPSHSEMLSQRVNEIQVNLRHLPYYSSEINLMLPSWIASLADCLNQGLILIIDYGFPEHEYYHCDRNEGTIMCHYRHHGHSNPLIFPGIQDMTAHVDFTAIARAAIRNGLTVAGFTHQAGFLLNCGLDQYVSHYLEANKINETSHFNIISQIKMLTSPSEMGELFKTIALTKNIQEPLLGFSAFNQIARLL